MTPAYGRFRSESSIRQVIVPPTPVGFAAPTVGGYQMRSTSWWSNAKTIAADRSRNASLSSMCPT
jgi:hypothetical protein